MLKTFLKNRDGIAAVEFALITPVMFVIILGLFDYGLYMNQLMQTDNALRATVQYMAEADEDAYLTPTVLKQDIVDEVLAFTGVEIEADDLTLPNTLPVCECSDGSSVVCATGDCGEDDYVRRFVEATIDNTYTIMIPIPGVGNSISYSKSMRLQIE